MCTIPAPKTEVTIHVHYGDDGEEFLRWLREAVSLRAPRSGGPGALCH